MLDSNRDFLLLDGDCGLCHQLAFFMDPRLAPDSEIAYRPIKSNDAQKLIHTFPKWQQRSDTVYLLRNGRSYIRSAAAIRCLLYLRWYWRIWFFIFWVIHFSADLQSFSFWSIGDDWIGFQYFARLIVLDNDWLRGGLPTRQMVRNADYLRRCQEKTFQ